MNGYTILEIGRKISRDFRTNLKLTTKKQQLIVLLIRTIQRVKLLTNQSNIYIYIYIFVYIYIYIYVYIFTNPSRI